MTSATIGLIGGIGVGLAILAVGLGVRSANGRRLIRGVDWTRVSDPDGLAQWISLLMLALAALIVGNTALHYVWRDEPGWPIVGHDPLAPPMLLVLFAMFLIKRRFQDRPARDGRR
jgi:hypothetical protein